MQKIFKIILIVAFLPLSVCADVLRLVNGDMIQGKKNREDGEFLIWQSPILGELRLPMAQVKTITIEPVAGLLQVAVPVAPKSKADINSLSKNTLQSIEAASADKAVALDEKFPPTLSLVGFNLDFSGERDRGNDNETSYSVDVSAALRRLRHRHYLRANYDYENVDNAKTQDEQVLGYKYNYYIEGPWLGYLSAERAKDQFSDVQERLTASGGPGYEFYDTKTLRWAFEAGPAYTREKLNNDAERVSWGLNYGMDWRWAVDDTGMELFQNHSFWQSSEQGSDWEFESESGIRWRLVGNLKAFLKYEYDYDNLPAADKNESDRTLSVGTSYGW